MSVLAAVCFIACHGGPADHFATFAENLPDVQIYASSLAAEKFRARGVAVKHEFSTKGISPEEEDRLAEQIAKACSTASIVMTDVGDAFDIKIQKALSLHADKVTRLSYYDNPEPFVPGGYSTTAAKVIQASQGVIFANSLLASTPLLQDPATPLQLDNLKKVGIGYYPIAPAKRIGARRVSERAQFLQQFLLKHELKPEQKVLVYFGGNNDTYFNEAFPAFLRFLTEADLSSYVVLVHQHPGAKGKNRDESQVAKWQAEHGKNGKAPKMILSDLSSEEAQIIADGALYYQTSMGPQFVLAGIPTIQVGHEPYEDILVRSHLIPSVTSASQLTQAVAKIGKQGQAPEENVILEGLGIKANWLEVLKAALKG